MAKEKSLKMASNFLGLCFLALGTTGIVNGVYINEGKGWNEQMENPWDTPLIKTQNFPNRFNPPYLKYRRLPYPYDLYKPSDYQIDTINALLRPYLKRKSYVRTYFDKNTINSGKLGNDEKQDNTYSNINTKATVGENNSRAYTQKILSDLSETPVLPNTNLDDSISSTLSVGSRPELDLHLSDTDKLNSSVLKNSSESKPDIILNSDSSLITSKTTNEINGSSFSTANLENKSSVEENSLSIKNQSVSTTQTSNSKYEDVSTTAVSSTDDEASGITSTLKSDSVTNNRTSLIAISPSGSADNFESSSTSTKISSSTLVSFTTTKPEMKELSESPPSYTDQSPSTEIQSTNGEISQEISTISHIPSKASEDSLVSSTSKDKESTDDISSNLSSIESKSPVSFTTTTPDTKESSESPSLYTDPSPSTEIQSTKSETSQEISTINHIPSKTSEDCLVSSTSKDKESTDDISSTLSSIESISPRRDFITETIPPDHVINISSIRTARVIVSALFLVISLICVAVLAVYVFRVRRRAVQYEQLLLLPE